MLFSTMHDSGRSSVCSVQTCMYGTPTSSEQNKQMVAENKTKGLVHRISGLDSSVPVHGNLERILYRTN